LPSLRPKVRLQRHVDHLNNGRDRMSGNRLEMNLQTVSKCLRLLRVRESDSPRCDRGGGAWEQGLSSTAWSSSTMIGLRGLGIQGQRPTGRSSTR
jgi:hypothetical protein